MSMRAHDTVKVNIELSRLYCLQFRVLFYPARESSVIIIISNSEPQQQQQQGNQHLHPDGEGP